MKVYSQIGFIFLTTQFLLPGSRAETTPNFQRTKRNSFFNDLDDPLRSMQRGIQEITGQMGRSMQDFMLQIRSRMKNIQDELYNGPPDYVASIAPTPYSLPPSYTVHSSLYNNPVETDHVHVYNNVDTDHVHVYNNADTDHEHVYNNVENSYFQPADCNCSDGKPFHPLADEPVREHVPVHLQYHPGGHGHSSVSSDGLYSVSGNNADFIPDHHVPSQEYTVVKDTVPSQEYTVVKETVPSQQYTLSSEAPSQQYTVDISQQYMVSDGPPSQQYIVNDGPPSQQYIVNENPPIQQYGLNVNSPSQEYIVNEDPTSQQYILNYNTPSQQYTVNEEPPSQQYLVNNDHSGQEYTVNNDLPSNEYTINNDINYEEYTINEDVPGQEYTENNDLSGHVYTVNNDLPSKQYNDVVDSVNLDLPGFYNDGSGSSGSVYYNDVQSANAIYNEPLYSTVQSVHTAKPIQSTYTVQQQPTVQSTGDIYSGSVVQSTNHNNDSTDPCSQLLALQDDFKHLLNEHNSDTLTSTKETLGANNVIQTSSSKIPDQEHPEKYFNTNCPKIYQVLKQRIYYGDTKSLKTKSF